VVLLLLFLDEKRANSKTSFGSMHTKRHEKYTAVFVWLNNVVWGFLLFLCA
jgi:hypothetical protein